MVPPHMQKTQIELLVKLAKAIEAVILPADPAAALGEAAQLVVMALTKASGLDESRSATQRRVVLDMLTPQGSDSYLSHAAKLTAPARHQAAVALFQLYASLSADPAT